jgi:hypothetical protein
MPTIGPVWKGQVPGSTAQSASPDHPGTVIACGRVYSNLATACSLIKIDSTHPAK